MRKLIVHSFCVFMMIRNVPMFLNLELARRTGAIPLLWCHLKLRVTCPLNVSDVVSIDLQMSGRFKVYGRDKLSVPSADVRSLMFRSLGVDNIVIGKVQSMVGSLSLTFNY